MYRLLLADDETATREGILEAINWRELGIGEVQSAKNGIAALEIAAEFVPDILLTDIKMPRMNGIDLAYKIRELNPDCSILIMSGYSEVDYLKSAIHLSAVNFVDKPVEIENWPNGFVNALRFRRVSAETRPTLRTEGSFVKRDRSGAYAK